MLKTNIEATKQLIADRQELLALPKGQLVDLILMMREQIASLQNRMAALEKNSTNSSKPPSSDMPGGGSGRALPNHQRNSRQPSGRQSGGQPGHQGSTRELVSNPDSVTICAPNACEGCGSSLAITDNSGTIVARSQVIDIPPIVPVTTEYQAASLTCVCGHVTNGQLPTVAPSSGTVTIGPNASSRLIYLNSAHHLPYARLQQVAADLFGLPLSQGTIANKLETAGRAATPVTQAILEYLRASSLVGSAETGVRVAGKRIWQWVWQNARAS